MVQLNSVADLEAGPLGNSPVTPGSGQACEPEFRVVTHEGARLGFRLEHLFWSILEAAASAKGMRIGSYIAEALEGGEASNNSSSVLRVHATQWIGQRLKESSSRTLSPKFVVKVVRASPLPCFVMDNDNRIAAQNDAFLALLRTQVLNEGSNSEATVHIRFRSDVASIRERLKAAQDSYIEDTVQIELPGRKREMHARITSIDSALGASLGLLVMISALTTTPVYGRSQV